MGTLRFATCDAEKDLKQRLCLGPHIPIPAIINATTSVSSVRGSTSPPSLTGTYTFEEIHQVTDEELLVLVTVVFTCTLCGDGVVLDADG